MTYAGTRQEPRTLRKMDLKTLCKGDGPPRPIENVMRCRESRRVPEHWYRGNQVAPTCFSCRFNYFISFAKFLKVTWHLAVVMKAISSLVPFPSVSYYAANTGWLAMLHSTKLRATLAHPLFNQCYPCHKLKSLHKIKFQEAKIDFEHISFFRNLVPCGIIEK